ncbi:MAG: response regulator [Lautropia sp.]|nr:response regulator [Lautropia sp.]
MAEILVVDDEMGIRELLSEILGDEGHSVTLAENAQRAREAMTASIVDLVLLDIWMPDTDGVTLLKEWAAGGQLTMPVIMMSGHATIETAVEATRIGALDFLEKPIALQKLLKAVEQGLNKGKSGAVPVRAMSSFQSTASSSPLSMLQVPGPQNSSHLIPLTSPSAQFLAAPAGGIPAQHLHPSIMARDLPLDVPLREARECFERAYFEHHLHREHGSMTRVAERTGLERTHLYRKLKQLGIDLSKGNYRRGASQAL